MRFSFNGAKRTREGMPRSFAAVNQAFPCLFAATHVSPLCSFFYPFAELSVMNLFLCRGSAGRTAPIRPAREPPSVFIQPGALQIARGPRCLAREGRSPETLRAVRAATGWTMRARRTGRHARWNGSVLCSPSAGLPRPAPSRALSFPEPALAPDAHIHLMRTGLSARAICAIMQEQCVLTGVGRTVCPRGTPAGGASLPEGRNER